jgi:hypothetical protein
MVRVGRAARAGPADEVVDLLNDEQIIRVRYVEGVAMT